MFHCGAMAAGLLFGEFRALLGGFAGLGLERGFRLCLSLSQVFFTDLSCTPSSCTAASIAAMFLQRGCLHEQPLL